MFCSEISVAIQKNDFQTIYEYVENNAIDKIKFLGSYNVFNNLILFRKLVDTFEVDLSCGDNILFRRAVANGNYDIVHFLIQNGIDVNVCNNFAIKVCGSHNLELLKLLVENGANICVDNNYPIRYAAYQNLYDIVKYLIENGADVNASNGYPLRFATCSINYEIIELLLENDADINFIGQNELLKVIRSGADNIVNLLITYGVDFSVINNYQCPDGYDYSPMIKLLIENGVDPRQLALILSGKYDIKRPGFE